MPWFSNRYYPGLSPERYKQPERFTPQETRERRLTATLERARKELEVRSAPLSQANKIHLQLLKDTQVRIQAARGERQREHASAVKSKDPRKIKAAQSKLLQLRDAELRIKKQTD